MRTVALCFVLLSSVAKADDWKTADKLMLGTAAALLVVDWGQTRDLTNPSTCTRWVENVTPTGIGARQETYECRTRQETNPILGDYPSRTEVDQYFALALIGTAGISYLLPSEYRKWFLGGVILLETAIVLRNHQIGLRVSF